MNHSLTERLWDSRVFGYKIGQTCCAEDSELAEILTQAKTEGYRLVYGVFAPGQHPSPSLCQTFGGKLVDIKIIFSMQLSEHYFFTDPACSSFIEAHATDLAMIKELAYQSGEYSRFRQDTNMTNQEFEILYNIWIEKSISKEIATDILVARSGEGIITGMVTYKLLDTLVEIGLIGIDRATRGKGLGTKLMHAVCALAKQNGCKTLYVTTQETNVQACYFYRKLGGQVHDQKLIYHFWL